LLITSLEEKINSGPSEVWKCLQGNGLTTDKLQEWKRKSLFYMGKAELKNKDFEDSVTHLETALALTPPNAKDIPILKDLLETARKYRAAELKKEKSTWSKAFKSSKAAHDADEAAAAAAAAAATPSGPQSPVNGAARSSSHASSSGTHAASSSTVNVSKGGDKVHIDMNSILGKDTKSSDSDSLDVVAKRDDTFFNMVFGLGFLSVLGGGLFWMYRTRFLRR
jgi:hypothetical protein